MDRQDAVEFLFAVSKEIKRSFESPVIFFTMTDYGDGIYRSQIDIRSALQRNAPSYQIIDIINNFHLDWIRAVRDIEDFKKRSKDTPHEVIENAIDYTVKCISNRYLNFKRFQQSFKLKMTIEDRLVMQADLEIMKDMKESVHALLQEKKVCFNYIADKSEYLIKLNLEIEELFNWLDRLNDSLVIYFSKVVNIQIPHFINDLTNTLKQIIDEVSISSNFKMGDKVESKGKLLCSMVRVNASHDLEVAKVLEKIRVLEQRIEQLKEEDSSAVLALQHKVFYLEERLQSLDNLKECLNALKVQQSNEINEDDVLDSTELHIFNHNLPCVERNRLVEKLMKLWEAALSGDDTGKSIISILSAADLKETYTDDIGQFTVDDYGRKIYSFPSRDTLFQLNERNELVELNDDDKHIYFYDDCGRYYFDEHRTRIYKAHENASEYEMDASGTLLKYREEVDGVEYTYDSNGRYYINDSGNRIYCDPNSEETYEQDGFGNLVRIKKSRTLNFHECPREPMIVKECHYLKQTVGDALKKCLANVLLHQPADPIGFLADNLVKYRQSIEERDKRLSDKKEFEAEKEYYDDTNIPLHSSYVTDEEETSKSSIDSNLKKYKTMASEECL